MPYQAFIFSTLYAGNSGTSAFFKGCPMGLMHNLYSELVRKAPSSDSSGISEKVGV